jgi:hypothetical protein
MWISYLHYTKPHLVVQGFQLEKFDSNSETLCMTFIVYA